MTATLFVPAPDRSLRTLRATRRAPGGEATPSRRRPRVAAPRRLSARRSERAGTLPWINSVRRSGYTLVRLSGDLDVVTSAATRQVLLNLLSCGNPRLVVDLSAVTFADACGLSPLVSARNAAVVAGGWVRLVGADDRLRRVLELSLITQALQLYDTPDEAAADAAGREPAPLG